MQLINLNEIKTMSTLEISKITNKEHRNILADVRKMLIELNISTANFSAMYKAENGQEYELFNLPKRECLILVSGYSIALRAKIIDRWQELESKSNLTVFNHDTSTHRGALLALVASLDKIEADKPKVQAFDTLIGADTIFSMNQTAKLLGWGRNKLFAELRNRSILMNNNLPYQAQIDNGRFVVKDTPIQRSIGTMVVSQSYVTTKGQVWLSKLLGDTK